MSALFLLATVAVMYAVVAMPLPPPLPIAHGSSAPVSSPTPDHLSFSALHSALLGSSLLPSPSRFDPSQGSGQEKGNLDWLSGWLADRSETTRLLVEVAKRINGMGRVEVGGGGVVSGNGTLVKGKLQFVLIFFITFSLT